MPSASLDFNKAFSGNVVPKAFKDFTPISSFSILTSILNLVRKKSITSMVEVIISGPIPSPSKAIKLIVMNLLSYWPLNVTDFLLTKASIPFIPSFVLADSAIILASYSICPSNESKKLL